MKLLAATGNQHKLQEIRRILQPLGIEVLSPAQVGVTLAAEETGASFAENARIKAQTLRRCTGYGVVADDSGLCVDALGGRPGIHSARYMGKDTPHSEKIAGLLRELDGVPAAQRGARFVAAVCCILADGTQLECEGVCEGAIALAPGGSHGFGYDPVFLVDGVRFAELPDEQKDALSHRGRALRQLAALLQQHSERWGKGEHKK